MLMSLIHASPFYELAALLALAAATGFVGLLLRQPMVVSFIAVGVLAGPSALDVVVSHDNVDLMAELGIALLLFLVGLKLDISLIRSLGLVALATGLGQVLFTSIFGFLIALALGLEPVAALYVAVALTFSSTIIIVKLLSDKREVDSLHGRIAIGFLIVQDVVVVIAMMVLSSFGVAGGDADGRSLPVVLASGIGMLVFVFLFIRYAATPLMMRVAGSNELMVIFAIAWAALLAAAGYYLGFSKELGGLLAGVSLATTPYRDALAARLSSLRDFLLLFFFVALGSSLDLGLLGAQVVPALVLSAFVLIGNPLIVLAIMGYLGYRKRTGFLAGLTVAQISEFSLIFMAMGVTLGHVSNDALGLVTLVGLISIALSVYMITYSYELYRRLEPLLGIFERRDPQRETTIPATAIPPDIDIILFGLGRYGSEIVRQLQEVGLRVFAVDFNPDAVQRGRALGITAVYGDAADPEVIDALPIEGVKWVISALPQHDTGLTHQDPRHILLDGLGRRGFSGRIALSNHREDQDHDLIERGAHIVMHPFHDAADRAVERVLEHFEGTELTGPPPT